MQDRATVGMAATDSPGTGSTEASMGTGSTATASTVTGSSWLARAAAGDRGGGGEATRLTTILRLQPTIRRRTTIRRPTTVRRRAMANRPATRSRPRRFRSRRRKRHRPSCSTTRAGTSCAVMACRRHTGGSGSRILRRRRHSPGPQAHRRLLPRADGARVDRVRVNRLSARCEPLGEAVWRLRLSSSDKQLQRTGVCEAGLRRFRGLQAELTERE